MKNMSPFQIIALVASGIIIIVGVLMFALSRNQSSSQAGSVTVWGTIEEAAFGELVKYLADVKKIEQTVDYRYIEPARFDTTFTEAMAEGSGPDVVLITDNRLIRHEQKLLQIQYEFFPERLYKDTFIEAGEIFTDENGIFAFPFLVDPLVMYWNRSLFTESGTSQAPRFWDELLTLAPALTKKDSSLTISQSAIAMGDYQNINHAKELLTTLLFQAGNPVVLRNRKDSTGDLYSIIFSEKLGFSVAPAQAAVTFYTQFADPSRSVYSWNRSMPDSIDAFIAGEVAMYFGFASEFATIRQKNPNLNFDVAVIPQSRSGRQATYGRVLALAIPRNTPNIERAYGLIQNMTARDSVAIISDILFLPPVRRDLLSGVPGNAYMQTFHNSALLSKTLYDFNDAETNTIFQRLIETVVAGRLSVSEAVTRTNNELQVLRP